MPQQRKPEALADPYKFSVSLPYLLARLGVRMGELFSRELARDGLTLSMYRVLAALHECRGTMRLGELALATSVETSTLSRLVADMQRRGWLTRERPEDDQRSLAVGLAPAGAALAARLTPRAAHYEQVVTGTLSAQQAARLKATLVQLHSNADELERELDAADQASGSGTVTPLRGARRKAG